MLKYWLDITLQAMKMGGINIITKIGEMDILPKVYYDPECFINIWCDYDVRNSRHFVTTEVRDQLTNNYLGYIRIISKVVIC